MHPNTFLDQLWNGQETDTVFVAMSFADRYSHRFQNVFRPAIEGVRHLGSSMRVTRVDESQSGDSIITEIVRGIAESRLVLVDISDISDGSIGAEPVRNGNVMYELGLAHAVKSPAKVAIVRDDSKKLLFDVSSIPHAVVDFSSDETARATITRLLSDRLRECEAVEDIKLRRFVESVSVPEIALLVTLFNATPEAPLDVGVETSTGRVIPLAVGDAIRSLREVGLIRSHMIPGPSLSVRYSLTERGKKACLTMVRSIPPKKSE